MYQNTHFKDHVTKNKRLNKESVFDEAMSKVMITLIIAVAFGFMFI